MGQLNRLLGMSEFTSTFVPNGESALLLHTSKGLYTVNDMNRRMGKHTICIGENKGADQLRMFRYTDSTIPLLSKSKISSL